MCLAAAAAGATALCATGRQSPACRFDTAGHGHHHDDSGSGHTHDHVHSSMPEQFKHEHHSDRRSHLLFAIPKKGRLHDKVAAVLSGSGIEYLRKDRVDVAHSTNLPMSIVFLPAKDIATYVAEGEVDLGITGEDCVAESEAEVDVIMKMGFGKCNLSVQGQKDSHISAANLAGKRIVTSFPAITQKYFSKLEEPGKPTQIKCISGSVEAAISLGLADGIVDLVETGTTMRAAGLEEVAVVMRSEAVLISNPHTKHPELVNLIRRRINGYMVAQGWVMLTYNVERANLKTCESITPGKRSPSVQPLEDPNWVAVAALVPKKNAAFVMDELERYGARDILQTSLLSVRTGD